MKIIKLALLVCFSVAVASCGGGGGGGGGVATPLEKVEITPANEENITANALDSSMGASVMGEFGPMPAKPSIQAAASSKRVLSRLTISAVQKIVAQRNAPASVTGAAVTNTCTGGGTVSYSSSTTSAKVTYNNCDYSGGGSTIDGTMSFSDMVIAEDSMSAKVSLNLALSDGLSTMTTSGAYSWSIAGLLSSTWVTILNGAHLKFTEGAISKELFAFSLMSTYDTAAGIYTDDNDFTFSSSAIGGSVTFETVTPFVLSDIATYPNSGVMKIYGANSSCLQVTVLGSEEFTGDQIQFERSADDCATYDSTLLTNWAALYP